MRAKSYRQRRPEPGDVLLLIEVAESSLAYDRGEKADLYATAGVQDYWIVNLNDLCIEVHRNPQGGKYRATETYQVGRAISPLAFPAATLDVAQVLSS